MPRRQSKSRLVCNASKNCNRRNSRSATRTNEIYIPAGPRLGDKVIEFKNVSKGYGDRVLIDNLSFAMPKVPSLA